MLGPIAVYIVSFTLVVLNYLQLFDSNTRVICTILRLPDRALEEVAPTISRLALDPTGFGGRNTKT